VADKEKTQSSISTVSSSRLNRTYEVRLNTLITTVVVIILLVLSFYGGTLYGHSMNRPYAATTDKAIHKFAIGLVVFTTPKSITINNENNKETQTFDITSNTIVSINGSPAKVSQIKPGNIVLIRMVVKKPHVAGVIIVNSHFSD